MKTISYLTLLFYNTGDILNALITITHFLLQENEAAKILTLVKFPNRCCNGGLKTVYKQLKTECGLKCYKIWLSRYFSNLFNKGYITEINKAKICQKL